MSEVVYAVVILLLGCVIIGVSLYSVYQKTEITTLKKRIQQLEKEKAAVIADAIALERLVEQEQNMNSEKSKALERLRTRLRRINHRLSVLYRRHTRLVLDNRNMSNENTNLKMRPGAVGVAYKPKNKTAGDILIRLQNLFTSLQLSNCIMLRQVLGQIIDNTASKFTNQPLRCSVLMNNIRKETTTILPRTLKGVNPAITPEQIKQIRRDILLLYKTVLNSICKNGYVEETLFRQTFADVVDSICYAS
jgi:hypothetical protein